MSVPTQTDKVVPRSIEYTFYAVVFVTLSTLFFWWTQQAPIAILERQLLTPIVKVGEDIRVRNVLYISENCEVDVERELIDVNGFVHKVVAKPLPAERTGTHLVYISSVTVPPTILPGDIIYRVYATWSCNVIQDIFPESVQLSDIDITIEE